MKIAFVVSHLSKYGGQGIDLMNYSNYLALEGHKVYIISQKVDTSIYKFSSAIRLVETGGSLPRNPLYWFLLLTEIKRRYLNAINNIKADIYISQNFPVHYFCTLVNRKSDSKILYHCYEPFRFFNDKKYIQALPLALRLIMKFLKCIYKKIDIIGEQESDLIISINFRRYL